jgi:hypothetical protein
VFFDPDRVVEAHADGLTHLEIHERAFAGEYLPDPVPDLGGSGTDG